MTMYSSEEGSSHDYLPPIPTPKGEVPVKALIRTLPLVFVCLIALPARGDDKKPAEAPVKKEVPALDKPAPESVEDLKAIQQRVKEVVKKILPATVGVQVGGAS